MLVYHGSNEIVKCPSIVLTEYTKDFGWGFYTTELKEQATTWAFRRARKSGAPTLNIYEYTLRDSLKILKFDDMTDEWLDFVVFCRGKGVHDYDIVIGPMADDQIWNNINAFLNGDMPRSVFMEAAKFSHPTNQISFHTVAALRTLAFLNSEVLEK